MGSVTLEIVSAWSGLGTLVYKAIGLTDVPVIVGAAGVYA